MYVNTLTPTVAGPAVALAFTGFSTLLFVSIGVGLLLSGLLLVRTAYLRRPGRRTR